MSELTVGIERWLEYTRPLVEVAESYSWSGDDKLQYFNFLKRAAVVRQTEALKAMLAMVEHGHGHFGVTFLRPAYEELIWIEYLIKNEGVANDIVILLAPLETADNLNAQDEFAGPEGMKTIGFAPLFVKVFTAQAKRSAQQLKVIGKALGWNMNMNRLPSTAWLSRKVGRHRDYKFLYHATSRFVHFSANELYRRVWGKQGSVTIGSTTFSDYWQDFALYWGFRLYVDLLIACEEVFRGIKLDDERFKEVAVWLEKFAQVPIITPEELKPWAAAPKGT